MADQYNTNMTGLQTTGSVSSNAVRKQGRDPRQKQTTRRINLQPQASPGSYYSRPANKQVGQKGEQLARALGNASPTIGKLGEYMVQKRRKQAETEAQADIQGMSVEEAREAVNSGQMEEHENPYYQEAFQKQYGVRLGLDQSRKLKAKMATEFNPRTDDVNEFIAENLGVDMNNVGQNPLVQQGFTAAMDDTLTAVRDTAEKQTAETFKKDTLDGVYETAKGVMDRALELPPGAEREQALAGARESLQSIKESNRADLNVSYGEHDQIMLDVAERYAAEGLTDAVDMIVNDERDGVGSIASKHGPQGVAAQKLLTKAESVQRKKNREDALEARMYFHKQARNGSLNMDQLMQYNDANPGALTDSEIIGLQGQQQRAWEKAAKSRAAQQKKDAINDAQSQQRQQARAETLAAMDDNNIASVSDVEIIANDGESTKTYSRKDQIEDAVEYRLNNEIPQEAQQMVEDGELSQDDVPSYIAEQTTLTIQQAGSKYNHKPMERQFQNVTNTVSPQIIENNNGEVPQSSASSLKSFMAIRANAPELAKKLAGSDFDAMSTMADNVSDMGMSVEDALKTYSRTAGESAPPRVTFDVETAKEIRNEVEDDSAWYDLTGGQGIKNTSQFDAEAQRVGQSIATSGGVASKDNVARRMKENGYVQDGYYTPFSSSTRTKDEFKTQVDELMHEYVDANPDAGIEKEELRVVRTSANSDDEWTLIDATTGIPVDDPNFRVFDEEDLDARESERKRSAAERAARGESSPTRGAQNQMSYPGQGAMNIGQ